MRISGHTARPKLQFRQATLSDTKALAHIEKATFPSTVYQDCLDDKNDFKDYIKDNDYSLIVAEYAAGKPIGFVLTDIAKDVPTVAHIDNIAVLKNARSLKVAIGLLRQAFEVAVKNDFTAITFEMHENNPAIAKFFEGPVKRWSGFNEYERESDYYNDGGTAVRFIRNL